MQLNESNDLMARWRATGGALGARPQVAGDGDDGLTAALYTLGFPEGACRIDDGLTAALYTGAIPDRHDGPNPLCTTDDGLAAMGPTSIC